jgi:hypothetical protein
LEKVVQRSLNRDAGEYSRNHELLDLSTPSTLPSPIRMWSSAARFDFEVFNSSRISDESAKLGD